jgi:disulfide bond formation protein DsbB
MRKILNLKKRKLDIVLAEDPAIPLLGIYPEDAPTFNKDTCSTIFIAALFLIARSWKDSTFPSTGDCIQKMWYIYTMEYYSAIKNNEFMKFCSVFLFSKTFISLPCVLSFVKK